jgi:predicted RNA-binding Zn ribbon-like protein
MEAVNLDLQLVRDFVNTHDLEAGVDELADARGLAAWLRMRGLWNGTPSAEDAAAAREAREALRDLMRANNGCDAAPEESAATLDGAARRAGVEIHFGPGALELAAPPGGIGEVLAAAGRTMADGSWQRLKACRSDTCRWAFVDAARNRSRQWCSMKVCGNRAKARAFRQRHRVDG